MTRRLLFSVILLALAATGVSVMALHSVWRQAVMLPQGSAVITIAPGESLGGVLARAEVNSWLTRASWVGLVARWLHLDQQIKAGEFLLESPLTAGEMIEVLAAGQVLQHTVTLPEGITLEEAITTIQEHPKVRVTPHDKLVGALLDLIARSDTAEGLFLPETWAFTAGDSDLDILRRAHFAMMELVGSLWDSRTPTLPFASPYEAIILASIVEKETGVPMERSQIAGVFVRRLSRGMRLQTDPTVIYGLGNSYDGNLTRRDLRDSDNPYNTYVIPALPPTPISLPGANALRAAFAPDDSAALYFVAKGDGSHAFSENLAEHEANVRRFQLNRRADYRSTQAALDAEDD